MLGRRFQVCGFKGVYEVKETSPNGIMAEAISDNGGRMSITKNKISGKWIASKGSKTFGDVRMVETKECNCSEGRVEYYGFKKLSNNKCKCNYCGLVF